MYNKVKLLIGLLLYVFSKQYCIAQPTVLATWPVGVPVCYLSFLSDGTYRVDTTGLWHYRHSNAACFATKNGQLLFQCNGTKVVNYQLQLLENGDSLTDDRFYNLMDGAGTSIVQSVLTLPKSGNTYWLFYYSYTDSLLQSGTGSPDRLYYAIIDMDANNGAGKVVQKKVSLHKGIMGDCRLTAVRHGNGRDWWLVNHGYNNDVYNKYLVTPDTVLGPFEQHVGARDYEPDLIGGAYFSQDGTKYASGVINSYLNIMDFDRCSGEFTLQESIKVFAEPPSQLIGNTGSAIDGLCFSPNGRYLYVNTLDYLLQYDTWADTIASTRILIAMVDSTYSNDSPFFTLAVTPTNKIMISNFQGIPASPYQIIHQPDSGGLACQFQKEAVVIPGSYSNYTLPNLVNLRLGALQGSGCDSVTTDIAMLSTVSNIINVYPNPVIDRVFIETRGYGPGGTLPVLNELGQTLYTNTHFDEATVIAVEGWPNGVYYWRFTKNMQLQGSGKILVRH